MSTVTRTSLAEAEADAADFRALFAGCFDRWEFAGSIRRRKLNVGDVEHVVIPKHALVPSAVPSLFADYVRTNLLLFRCDELLDAGTIGKHVYTLNRADGTTGTRTVWGDTARGVSFRGRLHEIFCARPDNWGCILTIRTGPGDFSRRLVTQLHGTPLRQADGFLRYEDGRVYPCPDERTFFSACGEPWREPEVRS